ncbi:MAG: succinylglutamate desuccinylase/aspartoacylase family protein [Anaerolineales bacterium]|nr:MAG: succinylglutamate desuccinylase/aspartoacylase family protein [Anaerolineales bacterium]
MAKLHTIAVEFEGQRVTLPHYRSGQGSRRGLIVAGIHGREHTSIQVAYDLVAQLENAALKGVIDIIPVANPLAYAAETRESLLDGLNLGQAFAASEPRSITSAIAVAIRGLVEGAEWVLDLHSAGEARYLPHVIFARAKDADMAASLGLPFAILRRRTREGAREGALSWAAAQAGTRGLALELGGGIAVFPEDVARGLQTVIAFLGQQGFLEAGDSATAPTARVCVYLDDVRVFVRAPGEGAFYPCTKLGAVLDRTQELGMWVALDTLRPTSVVAPCRGKLIYLRIRCRTPDGATLAMLLPERSDA